MPVGARGTPRFPKKPRSQIAEGEIAEGDILVHERELRGLRSFEGNE
jgi:hypothetical protein